jgi:hypothetical protein
VFHHPNRQVVAIQFVGCGLACGTGTDYQCIILLRHVSLPSFSIKGPRKDELAIAFTYRFKAIDGPIEDHTLSRLRCLFRSEG